MVRNHPFLLAYRCGVRLNSGADAAATQSMGLMNRATYQKTVDAVSVTSKVQLWMKRTVPLDMVFSSNGQVKGTRLCASLCWLTVCPTLYGPVAGRSDLVEPRQSSKTD